MHNICTVVLGVGMDDKGSVSICTSSHFMPNDLFMKVPFSKGLYKPGQQHVGQWYYRPINNFICNDNAAVPAFLCYTINLITEDMCHIIHIIIGIQVKLPSVIATTS